MKMWEIRIIEEIKGVYTVTKVPGGWVQTHTRVGYKGDVATTSVFISDKDHEFEPQG